MSGEIIRQGDPTSHQGTVLEGSLTDICHGKPIAYIGHKVLCPKCKGTFPIIEGVLTTTFYGKGVAIAGMKTACGAVLIATQFTDVVEVGTGGGNGKVGRDDRLAGKDARVIAAAVAARSAAAVIGPTEGGATASTKVVTRISWSYGENEVALSDISRFYVDLNLHLDTENYAPGEKVHIIIENDGGEDLTVGHRKLELDAFVGRDGKAKIKNVFAGKTVDITGSA